MKKIINRKNLILLFLTVLLFLFVGCNGTPPINHVPNITSMPINTATVETLYTYDVNATDSDADILTYALAVNPLGMTINSSTGVISWTPTSSQTGDYNVTVEVTDGEFQDTQTFVITVQLTVTVKPVHNITQSVYYATIQAALNDANSGDTIEVANGVYNESITFPSGKVIYLESIDGSASTMIEGLDDKYTITCNGAQQGTDIRGFTICHKSGDSGAGLYNTNGSVKITVCNISGNVSTKAGGGICNYKATLTIFGTNISENWAATSGGGILNDQGTLNITGGSTISYNSTDYGGGVCNYHGTLTIIGASIIAHNSATINGGGIINDHGTLTVTGLSTVSENSALASGGGIYNDHGTATVTGGSVISENSAVTDGGGIYNDDGTATVTDVSTVSENSAHASGGGIFNSYGNLTITGSTISENSTDTDAKWCNGGGICNSHGTLTVTQGSIISENSTYYWGGGICNSDGILTVTGSIISENSAYSGGGIFLCDGVLTTDIIGGSSSADTAKFNTFINNKKEDTVSSGQHIRGPLNDVSDIEPLCNLGDLHSNFPYNYYTPN